MREIKFRVWDKREKCMCYPQLTFYNNRLAIDISGYKFFKDDTNSDMRQYCEDNFIYMQFTGLKAHGKEIYEGDIVKTGEIIAEVYWREEVAGYEFIWKNKKGEVDSWMPNFDEVSCSWEIIGNIYEHKDLLK